MSAQDKSGAILGVDVGSVRIGVAVCERDDLPAVPLTTLEHASREKDAAAIAALARVRGARVIVVGYPLRLDGTPGPATERMDRFIEALRCAFDGEVVPVDERLTTAAAAKRLQESGVRASRRRKVVDRVAATEILESYRAGLRRRAQER